MQLHPNTEWVDDQQNKTFPRPKWIFLHSLSKTLKQIWNPKTNTKPLAIEIHALSMDARRTSRTVIDPKVRHVGFFTPNPDPDSPGRTPLLSNSPASNSLSPVMIPPPRLPSDRTAAVPVPETGLRRQTGGDHVAVGSYNPSESLLSSSPTPSSPSSRVGLDGEFSEESGGWYRRSNSGKFATGLPDDTIAEKPPEGSASASVAQNFSAPVLESRKSVEAPAPGNDLILVAIELWMNLDLE